MAELPANLSPSDTLKQQYVPLDAHEHANVNITAFLKEKVVGMLVGAGAGGVIGGYVGKWINPERGKGIGAFIGTIAGSYVTLFRQWSKTEGRQKHVQNNLESIKAAFDVAPLQKEVEQEAALVKDMQTVDALMAQRRGNHLKAQLARRDAAQDKSLG